MALMGQMQPGAHAFSSSGAHDGSSGGSSSGSGSGNSVAPASTACPMPEAKLLLCALCSTSISSTDTRSGVCKYDSRMVRAAMRPALEELWSQQ